MSTTDHTVTPQPQPPIWPELNKPTVTAGRIDQDGIGHVTVTKPTRNWTTLIAAGLIGLFVGAVVGVAIAHSATATPAVTVQGGAPLSCLKALDDTEAHNGLDADAWRINNQWFTANQSGDSGMAAVLTDQLMAKAEAMKIPTAAYDADAAACRAAG